MTFCKVCGKLLPNVRFDPTEVTICQKCADRMEEDVVRVVRCRDCKHWKPYQGKFSGNTYYQCEELDTDTEPEFFCANGEQ